MNVEPIRMHDNIESPSIRYFGMHTMTPEEWSAMPDNPRQRNTVERAKRAHHLKTPHPAHCKVNAAKLPNGAMYKIDGHTRGYLWHNGQVELPEKVFVDLWACRTIEDVKHLYSTFDSRAAVETTTDQVFGAERELGVEFQSELLRSRRYANASKYAYEFLYGQAGGRRASTHDVVRYWLPELMLLDQVMPTRKRFVVGVMTAALITLRRHGPDALEFWSAYASNSGSKISGEADAVQALSDRIERITLTGNAGGRVNVKNILCIALSAYMSYRRGHIYQASAGIKGLKEKPLQQWLNSAKNSKRRW